MMCKWRFFRDIRRRVSGFPVILKKGGQGPLVNQLTAPGFFGLCLVVGLSFVSEALPEESVEDRFIPIPVVMHGWR